MRFFISIFFVSLFVFNVNAQYKKAIPFKQEVYLSANTGVNYFLAEGFKQYSISNALGFIGRTSVGYNFDPIFGVRGSISYTAHKWPDKNNGFNVKSFYAQNLVLDAVVNLSNLGAGYHSSKQLNVSISGGAGIGYRGKADFSSDLIPYIIHGGMQADYAISSVLSLNLLADLNFVSDFYNDFQGTLIPVDIYPAISVGLSYKIPLKKRILHHYKYDYNENYR